VAMTGRWRKATFVRCSNPAARARAFAGPVDIDAQHRHGRTDIAERSACLAPVTGFEGALERAGDSPGAWTVQTARELRARGRPADCSPTMCATSSLPRRLPAIAICQSSELNR
jgi:hypothetical protein